MLLFVLCTVAEQRFLRPNLREDTNCHRRPHRPPRVAMQYVDVAVLLGGLGVATWLVYRRRSRAGLVGLSMFSLV
jgi:hypothetical protein